MKDVKVVLVTGSRYWADGKAIYKALDAQFPPGTVGIVRHGHCPTGADHIADNYAMERSGIAVDRVPAEWEVFGKGAGPRRNTVMAGLGADICLAFPLADSRGTRDCMRKAALAAIKVINLGNEQ